MKIRIYFPDNNDRVFENCTYQVYNSGNIHIYSRDTEREIAVIQHSAGCLLEVIEE